MKPLQLRRLGIVLLASGFVYKKISRLAAGDAFSLKKEEHLEEPGTAWFLIQSARH
ncbi:hypothetical protein [Neobacillus notoginsengisoli]|uniref:hypothetical protein n=1 Tax=Neobacillus notoginsengisoli TaxID=1578198 RepID=UPI0013145EEA|nr:hypothetical protein [Neobacillus notoginsengisoli]